MQEEFNLFYTDEWTVELKILQRYSYVLWYYTCTTLGFKTAEEVV